MLAHGMEGERIQDEGGREKKVIQQRSYALVRGGPSTRRTSCPPGRCRSRARLASHNTIECQALILYLELRIHRLYRVLHDANLFTNLHA